MNKTQTIIGIAGASGAGKSVLAGNLCSRLQEEFSPEEITILNEDCYYRRRDDLTLEQRNEINYDHPDALEHSLLSKHLEQLQHGESIEVPQYNYALHNRKDETVTLRPSRILILEGHPDFSRGLPAKTLRPEGLRRCSIGYLPDEKTST